MSAISAQPIRVEGRLDPQLTRWLWLVKWLLVAVLFRAAAPEVRGRAAQ